MLFAHIADCHLGGWRDPLMRALNIRSFETAMQHCIKEKVDFVLLCGDLFNTAIPSIDAIRTAFDQLRQLKDAGIPLYFIAGSHDCSPSGKSILDVVESAGLGINVSRGESTEDGVLLLQPVTDPKTGVKICGLLGKKGGLERHYFEALDRGNLESLRGPKIFLFHGSIAELKPDDLAEMDAFGVSLLPQGFDYYAGGHIHIVKQQSFPGYLNIVYPGPTFPNNFAELEKLETGRFCLVRDWQPEEARIDLVKTLAIAVDVDGKSPAEAEMRIRDALPPSANGAIVLLRVEGKLREGTAADIHFKELLANVTDAYAVLKNTGGLANTEFEEVDIGKGTLEEIEEHLATEHAGKTDIYNAQEEIALTKELMRVLATERKEGEKVADFEKRIEMEATGLLH